MSLIEEIGDLPADDDCSYSAIIKWLRIGMTIRVLVGGTIFSFERAQDDSDNWWLWANETTDRNPFLELTFNTLEEFEAYEYMPGQTLADIWQPEMLYAIE